MKVEDIPEPVVEGSRQAEIVEEIEEDNEVGTSAQSSRKTQTTQSSSPHPPPRHDNFSFNNTDSGVMINRNIGNIYNSILQVGSNDSVFIDESKRRHL